MRILLVTNDPVLKKMIQKFEKDSENTFSIHSDSSDPLDIMSKICLTHPGLLIIDDDYVRPRSVHMLKTIKKVQGDISIIFITSDASLELGSEVSQLGIQYYALKPVAEDHLNDSLNSILKLKSNQNY